MLKLNIAILGAGWIAPQGGGQPAEKLSAQEPDYAGMISPMQLRRMSKAVRMGIGAAKACLADAGVEAPDGIATGTGLGCLQDTEVFLKKLVQQEEQMLTPTSFIQSTHNTVAGQIALLSHCHGFNTTVSQHGHSFEGAFVAAAMHMASNPGQKLLCGGIDELTETAWQLMNRAGVYTATAAGEGAGFLLLGDDARDAGVRITGMHQFHEPDATAALRILKEALSDTPVNGTALWTGPSGETGRIYDELAKSLGLEPLSYKASSGDWSTAVSVALAKAVNEWPADQQRLILVSNFGSDWSIWILKTAGVDACRRHA
jgi:3-oxoacyl-[acyl-carrier-protein] synthase II